MPEPRTTFSGALGLIQRHRGLILPVVAAALIFVILVPLPPMVMDILLSANIALAAIVLLTTIYVSRPLEFSVLPSVLLTATVLRLVLNVASTRLILTAGEDGRTAAQARYAAGHVIWSFSDFVASGSLAVGVIIFAIIIVIQFVVITRGAGRIGEVAARFVLDAMPGKQMAIDGDLSGGLIDETEARRRREEIAREADFYGAMDGASKFVRGDAIAAVLITLVNILGGIYVGMVQYGWSWAETSGLFTRLTIGDGLVTQIPAFIVSISAAMIITRSTSWTNLGEEIVSQLTARPIALAITAVFLGMLAMTSLPKAPLLLLGVGCGGLAWILHRREEADEPRDDAAPAQAPAAPEAVGRDHAETLTLVDTIRVDVGYGLAGMVEPPRSAALLERIGSLRARMASELGLLVPPIRIRDDMRLHAHEYVVKVRGARAAVGTLYPARLLALSEGQVRGKLTGRDAGTTPYGLAGVWIDPSQRGTAEMLNYRVVDAESALLECLDRTIRARSAELLSREQVARMLDGLKAGHPHLVAEVTEHLKIGQVQKVLQNLLRERVPINDLEAILEAAGDAAEKTDDIGEITARVRIALGSALSQQHAGADGKLWCVSLDPELEDRIAGGLRDADGVTAGIPPAIAAKLVDGLRGELEKLRQRGARPVVLCAPSVRPAVRDLVSAAVPEATVLAYNEIDNVEVQSVTTLGSEA